MILIIARIMHIYSAMVNSDKESIYLSIKALITGFPATTKVQLDLMKTKYNHCKHLFLVANYYNCLPYKEALVQWRDFIGLVILSTPYLFKLLEY